jgi:hypothetical protein
MYSIFRIVAYGKTVLLYLIEMHSCLRGICVEGQNVCGRIKFDYYSTLPIHCEAQVHHRKRELFLEIRGVMLRWA